jgi:hypothetical protein
LLNKEGWLQLFSALSWGTATALSGYGWDYCFLVAVLGAPVILIVMVSPMCSKNRLNTTFQIKDMESSRLLFPVNLV